MPNIKFTGLYVNRYNFGQIGIVDVNAYTKLEENFFEPSFCSSD